MCYTMDALNTYDSSELMLDKALVGATTTVRTINKKNGWYDSERDFSADIALLHSEVSEAFEAFRKDDNENLTEEMADIFIRLIDTCDRLGINLALAFIAKCKKNAERSYRHGGKKV